MSMWEFAACVEGYARAHGDNKPKPPTEEEFNADWAREEEVFGPTVH